MTVPTPLPAAAATNLIAFTVDSLPGDGLARGATIAFTAGDAAITADVFAGDGILLQASNAQHGFMAIVRPANGQSLAPGSYDTTRGPSDTTAGLDVSGDGVGCNDSTGILTVHEVSIQTDPDLLVERFAATYQQTCQGSTQPMFGELRYRSSFDFRAATVDPFAFDFGDHIAGTTSAAMPVTITNAGTLDLSLGSAAVSGPAAGDFAITSDACSNATLAPGSSCTIEATFAPGDAGVRNAILHLSDDTARGGRDVPLTGTGVKLTTAVTLQASALKVHFGKSVRLTAHLQDFTQTISRSVGIYAKPYGSDTYRLVTSANVDGSGNLSVLISMKKKTTFVAKFLGDAVYRPATSTTKTVSVYAAITGSLSGTYGSAGGSKLYHYTSACPGEGRGCPTFTTTVTPNHAGKPVCFTLQVYVSGAWRTAVSCFRLRLNSRSKATAVFVYASRAVIGMRTRIRATFGGDTDHLGATTPWAYFKVTT